MLEKFQPIKIAKRSYWLDASLTKSKSILTENVLSCTIRADIIIFFCFSIFRKSVSLKYQIVPTCLRSGNI